MSVSYIKVYFDFEERTEGLTDTEKGRLLLAMLRYASSGEKPALNGNERFVWPMLKMEFDRQMAVYQTKVENGQRGGRPPRDAETENNRNETENNRTKPDGNRNETENNRNVQEEDKEEDKEKEEEEKRDARQRRANERARNEAQQSAWFGMFWLQYPRKEGKKAAEREWSRIRMDKEIFDAIMEALGRQRKSEQWTRDGGQFIPHASTWLHGERWKDETGAGGGRTHVSAQEYSQRDYSGEDLEAMERLIAEAGAL